MADNPEIQTIVLDDFRPGIYDTWAAGDASAPDGAAQLSGTWGCVASRTGSLIAAPKKIKSQTQALVDANGSGKYPTGDARMHVVAMRNFSPVYRKSATGIAQSDYPDAPTVVFSWWYDSAGGGTNFKQRGLARIYKMFLATVASYDMIDFTSLATQAVGTKPPHGWGGVDIGRANDAHSDVAGIPIVGAFFFGMADPNNYKVRAFPDQGTVATDGVDIFVFETLQVGPYAMFAHQDRFCIFALGAPVGQTNALAVDFGTSGGTEQSEWIHYTNTNSVTGGSLDNNAIFVNENPFGYGTWKSVNAGELFLVKKRGGGLSVRGDFDRPTVVRLPGIESTGLAVNIGCTLPDGTFLYGSERGVYAWSGGDTVKLLSPQIEGWFWKATSPDSPTAGLSVVEQLCNPLFYRSFGDDHAQCMGSWAMCGDRLVYGPNNFCYDSMGGGWFIHTNPADGIIYGYHDTSVKNRVIAAPYYVDATQTEVLAWFDPNTGQNHYKWTGQPLKRTRGRVIQIKYVDVVVQGHGTIIYTLTGIEGQTATKTITISTDQPITVNIPELAIKSHDISLTIDSTGTTGSDAGPEVIRAIFGYYEQETARQRTARP